MHFARLSTCLAVAVLLSAAAARAQTTFVLPDTSAPGEAERAILRLEQARSAAIAAHDTATLRRIYAEEFRGVTGIGYPVDFARLLDVFSRDDPSTVFTIDEIAVRTLAEDVAMLTARLTTRRRDNGEVLAQSRFLHVYVLRDGRWQIVAAQGTAVRPPPSS